MAAATTAEQARLEGTGLASSANKNDSPNRFDELMEEQDEEVDNYKNKDLIAQIMSTEAYKLNEKSLECPGLE